jgi:Family of unknown function (DUF6152)
MNLRVVRSAVLAATLAIAGASTLVAHHEPLAKFDDKKPLRIRGVVSLVDWRNPHAHVFVNVKTGEQVSNWAVELESPVDLEASGWSKTTIQPGDQIAVAGFAARDGSRQMLGKTVVTAGGKPIFTVNVAAPPMPLLPHPTPKWPDGQPRLGSVAGGVQGYWAFPSATALVENGVSAPMDEWGLLKNIADAPKVAPMQPWALQLYKERQQRFLRDDPMYLNCKPPGGPRQFELAHGVQFVEDRARQRVFVLIGSGNNNYRIIYTDGRSHQGQVGGDDENPLFYGRAVAKWEGDTFVVDTRGFNEDFWFTNGGLPHTDQLKLIEKISRPNLDTLKYDLTVDDPGAYTRPWSASWTLRWVAGKEMPRHLCQENRS